MFLFFLLSVFNIYVNKQGQILISYLKRALLHQFQLRCTFSYQMKMRFPLLIVPIISETVRFFVWLALDSANLVKDFIDLSAGL